MSLSFVCRRIGIEHRCSLVYQAAAEQTRNSASFPLRVRNRHFAAYPDPAARKALRQGVGSRKAIGYRAWWDLPALPQFNTDTPAVREFLWNVATYWVEFGIDGWRLDVPTEIDDDAFWQEFRRRVKAVNPEAYLVGEIWHES